MKLVTAEIMRKEDNRASEVYKNTSNRQSAEKANPEIF